MIINHCHTHARIEREGERKKLQASKKYIHSVTVDEGKKEEQEKEEKNTQ